MRTNLLDFLPPRHRAKVILFVACIVTVTLIFDTSIIRIYYFEINPLFSEKSTIFAVAAAIFIITQYLMMETTKLLSGTSDIRRNLYLTMLGRTVTLVQSVLVGLLLFVLIDIFHSASYRIGTLIAATALSSSLATVLMAFLSFRFFSWFRSNKNFAVLFYALSFAAIAFNTIFGIVSVALALQNQPPIMVEREGYVSPFYSRNPVLPYVNYSYLTSSVISFVLTWIPTAFLLRHYFHRLNRAAFWTIISLPLAYFLIQFQPMFFGIFSEFSSANPVFFGVISTLLFSWSRPIGGVLFAVAFFVIATKIKNNDVLRNYVIISGCGYMLLFVSNQAIVLISAPYPPFGLITVSLMGLSSYLVLLGVYSCAISMSEDMNLRRIVRKSAIKELSVIGSIGIAERDREISQKVLSIAREQAEKMSVESGISSFNEDELRQYLDDVLEEIRNKKAKNPIG